MSVATDGERSSTGVRFLEFRNVGTGPALGLVHIDGDGLDRGEFERASHELATEEPESCYSHGGLSPGATTHRRDRSETLEAYPGFCVAWCEVQYKDVFMTAFTVAAVVIIQPVAS